MSSNVVSVCTGDWSRRISEPTYWYTPASSIHWADSVHPEISSSISLAGRSTAGVASAAAVNAPMRRRAVGAHVTGLKLVEPVDTCAPPIRESPSAETATRSITFSVVHEAVPVASPPASFLSVTVPLTIRRKATVAPVIPKVATLVPFTRATIVRLASTSSRTLEEPYWADTNAVPA